jgi:chemotaxis receptor (MCP) glutamine deamidase CheD
MLQSALAPAVCTRQRNAEAAREQLKALGLGVGGERLGGTRGRTVRLVVATGRVTAAESGDQEVEL